MAEPAAGGGDIRGFPWESSKLKYRVDWLTTEDFSYNVARCRGPRGAVWDRSRDNQAHFGEVGSLGRPEVAEPGSRLRTLCRQPSGIPCRTPAAPGANWYYDPGHRGFKTASAWDLRRIADTGFAVGHLPDASTFRTTSPDSTPRRPESGCPGAVEPVLRGRQLPTMS